MLRILKHSDPALGGLEKSEALRFVAGLYRTILVADPFRPAADIDASSRNACFHHGQMVATGRDTRATAVDDVGVRHSVEDRFEFLPQRFRIFETLVGTQIVAARTVQTARNVAALGSWFSTSPV